MTYLWQRMCCKVNYEKSDILWSAIEKAYSRAGLRWLWQFSDEHNS